MRILLTHHLPLAESAAGAFLAQLALDLLSAGHRVRSLIVDRQRFGPDDFSVRRVVCDPDAPDADLDFPLPTFESGAADHTFEDLTNHQLNRYREVLRAALDDEINHFDPHVIHAQHVWVQGHLALETGVPYVLTAWGEELPICQRDARYRRYAQEAAENAGRVLAHGPALCDAVIKTFDDLEDRVQLVSAPGPFELLNVYQEVLRTRFGRDLSDIG
jgi:hypothetical protein